MKPTLPIPELPRERAIRSEHFKTWSSDFVTRYGGQKTAKSKAKVAAHQTDSWTKRLVSDSLAKLGTLTIPTDQIESLKTNLLFACYMARHSIDADSDPVGKDRENYRSRIRKLPPVVNACAMLVKYLSNNRDLANSVLLNSAMSEIGTQARSDSLGINDVRVIEALLVRLADGFSLMQKPDHPGLMDICIDYAYGPLLIMNTDTTRVFATGKKMNVLDVGLMFHLTYIFRYFTNTDGDKQPRSIINKHGELIINGPMIKCGKPNRDIVAHLVNATFQKKENSCYTGEDVKERLSYLLESKQAIKPKPGSPMSEVEFFGWSAKLPTS